MWYQTSYRRHLCDMHIEDWSDEFLRDFSPEAYLECLETAQVDCAMLYLQSHVGLCYYPTRSGVMHRALRGDPDKILRLNRLCREAGIRTVAYYSLIFNTREHDRHPDWRMQLLDGRSQRECDSGSLHFAEGSLARYGLVCPNNPDYRAFVELQIDEILAAGDFDGMFFDMLYWQHLCYCPHCRARWRAEVGGDIPENPAPGSHEWMALRTRYSAWMGEFAQWVSDLVHARRPALSVEHNFASAACGNALLCCDAGVSAASDYTGGDLYGGRGCKSFVNKFFHSIGRHEPHEFMVSRCTPNLGQHTVTKSEDALFSEVMLASAHHGATLMIDAIDPRGTLDRRVYERFGAVYRRSAPYEPHLHGEFLADVGVYYSLRSKFGAGQCNSHTAAIGGVEALSRAHILCDVCGEWSRDLNRYPVLVLPMLTQADAAEAGRLRRYVEEGGRLYLSGGLCPELIESLLGAHVSGFTAHTRTYMAPTAEAPGLLGAWFDADAPLPCEGSLPLLEEARGQVLATVTLPYTRQDEGQFASIHSNPPGIPTDSPAVLLRSLGKGRVLWSAYPLEAPDSPAARRAFVSLIRRLLPRDQSSLWFEGDRFDDTEEVEALLCREEKLLRLSLVRFFEGESAQPISDFTVCLPCGGVRAVRLLPEGEACPYTFDGAVLRLPISGLRIAAMYEIETE